MNEDNAGSTSSEAERVKIPVRFSDQVVYFRRTPSPDENDRGWSETPTEPSTSDNNYNGDVDNPVESFLSDSNRERLERRCLKTRIKVGLLLYICLAIGFFTVIHLSVPANAAKYIVLCGLPIAVIGLFLCILCLVKMETANVSAQNSRP